MTKKVSDDDLNKISGGSIDVNRDNPVDSPEGEPMAEGSKGSSTAGGSGGGTTGTNVAENPNHDLG